MTILIIGLGSMGRRRLRLLQQLRPDIRLCGVDTNEDRRAFVRQEHGIPAYTSIQEAIKAERPQAVVISTSPLSHAAIIRESLEAGLHVFTELNLVADRYAENMALAHAQGRVLFLSSTFLYREEIRYIMDRAQGYGQPLNYRYHVGQYLPDWHPWEDYTQYFVGDTRTNGCREVFAIELPWLCEAFGQIKDIRVIRNKVTGLRIAYADSYMVLLTHESGHMGSLCVDVVSRKPVRLLELYGEEIYLTWSGTPDTLREWDIDLKKEKAVSLREGAERMEGYAPFVVENAYRSELAAYLEAIELGTKPRYGFEEDLEIIRILDRIEAPYL